MQSLSSHVTAFAGRQKVAAGDMRAVAAKLKPLVDAAPESQILIFDDRTGTQLDLNLHGSLDDVLRRLPVSRPTPEQAPDEAGDAGGTSVTRSVGRPKLGVVGREVTLLPRHWEWLADQPGGASVAIRKLVEHAQRANRLADQVRLAREASYKFMSAMAGDLRDFEEATRALFAGDKARLLACMASWPDDIRSYTLAMAEPGLQSLDQAVD